VINIPESQVRLHRTAETLAIVAVAPFMLYLASRKSLPQWARTSAGVIALGTLLIDGYLLSRWSQIG
jgi:hypothetical protein